MSVSTEDVGDCLVVVFFLHVGQSGDRWCGEDEVTGSGRASTRVWLTVSRDNVPRCRVERYGRQGKEEG
jgi:hypothetical protein